MRHISVQAKKRIMFAACWHVGNPGCRESKIEQFIERVNETNAGWYHLGDIIEAICPTDKRFNMETHSESVLAQMAHAAELMRPARKNLLGIMIGNHEDRLAGSIGNVTSMILDLAFGCSDCGSVKYKDAPHRRLNLTGAAFSTMACAKRELVLFTSHSRISIGGMTSDPERDMVNKQVKLRRYLSPWVADIKVVAHAHRSLVAPPVSVDRMFSTSKSGAMIPVEVKSGWCAVVPSMFASYDDDDYPSYAEMALFPPTDIGWVEAEIDVKHGVVENVVEVKIR